MLSAQHLVKSFAGRRVIENVTLRLERGEVVGLLGPNGAGKTTTFQMLTGMLTPDAGQITMDGHNVTTMPFYDRARFGIAYLPQAPFVPRGLSVEQNITLVLEARLEASARKAKMEELVEEFRLGEVRKSRQPLRRPAPSLRDRNHTCLRAQLRHAGRTFCRRGPPCHRRDREDDPLPRRSRHRRLDHRP
jgi:ABC-type lipopolysaccharide export system ATPase subunit